MKSIRGTGATPSFRHVWRKIGIVCASPLLVSIFALTPLRADQDLVGSGSQMKYIRNGSDPGLGLSWTAEEFDDSLWATGQYGIGFDSQPPGALSLLKTIVSTGANSLYTRARFTVGDPSTMDW